MGGSFHELIVKITHSYGVILHTEQEERHNFKMQKNNTGFKSINWRIHIIFHFSCQDASAIIFQQQVKWTYIVVFLAGVQKSWVKKGTGSSLVLFY